MSTDMRLTRGRRVDRIDRGRAARAQAARDRRPRTRRTRPTAPRPTPSRTTEAGSGTTEGTPVTFVPGLVPNSNRIAVIVVPAVTPAMARLNVAVFCENGLCSPLVIEPLPLPYLFVASGSPMMVPEAA